MSPGRAPASAAVNCVSVETGTVRPLDPVGVGLGAGDAVGEALGLASGPPKTSSSSTVKPAVPAYWLR